MSKEFRISPTEPQITNCVDPHTTVKLDDKESFDKEQIGDKESFLSLIVNSLHKDKEHLALRNNFWTAKKFPNTKFDCTIVQLA